MSVEAQQNSNPEQKQSDKELNFRQLEAKYEKLLYQERVEKEQIKRELEEKMNSLQRSSQESEDEESEPFVDHKKLNKKLTSFEKKLEEKIDKKAEEKARNLLEAEKRESWIRTNPDFYDVLQHAEKLAEKHPELADPILKMPEGFERQRLVYSNIKALGLHKPEQKVPSIQEKIDANRRSPYYQPSDVSPSPYAAAGDFSQTGQQAAYKKMQELKNRLRI